MLSERIGFKQARRMARDALESGSYAIPARKDVDAKNLLATGAVTEVQVIAVLDKCMGQHHQRKPHHAIAGVDVHVFSRDGWYIKVYFVDPQTFFLSVHK